MKKIVIILLLTVAIFCVTQQEAEQCLQLNCPIDCPDEGPASTACKDQLKQWDQSFIDDKNVCSQYRSMYSALQADGIISQEILSKWNQCHDEWKSVSKIDDYVSKYIAQCEDYCVTKGIPEPKQNQQKKSMIEKCNKINCKSIEDSCVSDGPCNEHLTVYEECKSLKSKKSQCVKAVTNYNLLKDNDDFPYSMHSCEESCKIHTQFSNFNDVIKCHNSCEQYFTSETFSRQQLETCQTKNLPDCPSFDKSVCEDQKKIFTDRISCDDCKFEENLVATEDDKGEHLLPSSCSICLQYAYTIQKDDKLTPFFTDLYIPVMQECAAKANIETLQATISTTISSVKKCQTLQTCPEDKPKCKEASEKFEECKTQSKQCSYAYSSMSELKDDQKFPYSVYVCNQACHVSEDPDFVEVQNNLRKCLTEEVPDPEVAEFTYEQFLQCIALNTPECQETDLACNGAVQLLVDSKKTLKECSQCEIDKKNPTTKAKFPLTCQQCEVARLEIQGEDAFPRSVQDFYIPATRDCAMFNNVKPQQNQFNATVKQQKDCIAECDECKVDDQECKKSEEKYFACKENSNQCKLALQELKTKKDGDVYPYSMIVCEESCKIKDDDGFYLIQKQWEECVHYIPEPEEDPDFQNFKYADFVSCMNLNVPSCQKNDKQCSEAVEKLQAAKDSENNKLCQQCYFDLKHFTSEGRMPVSCTDCEFSQFEIEGEFPAIILNFYKPATVDCAEHGKIINEQQPYDATVKEQKECDAAVTGCNDLDTKCKDTQKAYDQCITDSEQCQAAMKEFDENKRTDADLYPYSLISCSYSCTQTSNAEFQLIEESKQKCFKKSDPVDPRFLDFLFQDYADCVSLNVLDCNADDTVCKDATAKMSQYASTDAICKKCQVDQQDNPKKLMPKSCSECYASSALVEGEWNSAINDFYIPAIRECALTGKIERLQSKYKSSYKDVQDCPANSKCITCSEDDENCKSDQAKYQAYVKNSKQCQKAYELTKDAKPTDVYPFSVIACEHSALVATDSKFKIHQKCQLDCLDQEPSPGPDFKEFTYLQYEKCIKMNEPECQKENKDCLKGYETLLSAREQDQDCKKCTTERHLEAAKGRMPVSCTKCNENLIKMDGKFPSLIVDFVFPAMKYCSETGSIAQAESKFGKTLKEVIDCDNKIKKCDAKDDKCNFAQLIFNNCVSESEFCQDSETYQKTLKETDPYPFSGVGCYASCKIKEVESFSIYQAELEKCFNYIPSADPEPEINVQSFTFADFEQCVQRYVPVCSDFDKDCARDVKILTDRLTDAKSESNVCKQCELEKHELNSTSKSKDTFQQPVSCSLCISETMAIKEDDDFSPLIKTYYIPGFTNCANYGKILNKFKDIDATIPSYKACQSVRCITCPADNKECLTANQKYTDCMNKKENAQCSFALFEFKQNLVEDFPYSYLICQESCKVDDEELFSKIQDCYHQCEEYSIEREIYNFKDVQNCLDRYQPVAQNQSMARKNETQISLCFIMEDMSEECKFCRHLDADKNERPLYPSTCIKCKDICQEKFSKTLTDPFYQQYIQPVFDQCIGKGKFSYKDDMELPFEIKATKNNREDCLEENKCQDLCQSESCHIIDNKYEQCIKTSPQCSFAQDLYKNATQVDLVPIELEVCRLGCIPDEAKVDKADDEFNKLNTCQETCNRKEQISEYFSFNTTLVNECIRKNVPICPFWDKECQFEENVVLTCYKSSGNKTIDSCKQCQDNLNRNQSLSSRKGRHPVTCAQCMNECEQNFDHSRSKAMTDHIMKTQIQCHNYGKIVKPTVSSISTVRSTIKCEKALCRHKATCQLAKNISKCRSDLKMFDDCITQSKQCVYAQNEWNQMATEDSNSTVQVPYPKLVCDQVCQPQDAGEDFKLGSSCNEFCFSSGYEPEYIKPDDPNPPSPDPPKPNPDKKDDKGQILLQLQAALLIILCLIF